MSRLTDDELGVLLRETFTEREDLADQLPEETRRARRAPVLLAATVLAVVAGVLYGVHRAAAPDPVEPAATAADRTSRDARVWALAIETIVRKDEPKTGWTKAIVMDLSDVGNHHLRKGPSISGQQRKLMGAIVHPTVPLQFADDDPSPAAVTCPDPRAAVLQVSDVVEKSGHLEVSVGIFYGCTRAETAKYKIERKGQDWVVTANLGQWGN
ncbi:hypothetical protein ACQPYH_02930 [Kribbella sp. CA-245084]|uniref:hypothetical protein n=1 Tax=Kribbella sp. CA-245084 TaxID=3239940 RepID=UPI003D9288E1